MVEADCADATLDDMYDVNVLPMVATDECDEDLDYEIVEGSVVLMSGGCIGTWYRQWMATDDCDNVSYADQYVMLDDNTIPTWDTLSTKCLWPTSRCSLVQAVKPPTTLQ